MAAAPGALKAACWTGTAAPMPRTPAIRLAAKPAPLWQLLVLATLLSARISSDIATTATRELFDERAGHATPPAWRRRR